VREDKALQLFSPGAPLAPITLIDALLGEGAQIV
jgi:hypothetical protein